MSVNVEQQLILVGNAVRTLFPFNEQALQTNSFVESCDGVRQLNALIERLCSAIKFTRSAEFDAELRLGHQVTLAARERGVILRPLGDVIVLMPAPAMPLDKVTHLCDVALESIDVAIEAVNPH